ncbi:hypothetical protein ACHAWF_004325 [Thalassiosira exigua]
MAPVPDGAADGALERASCGDPTTTTPSLDEYDEALALGERPDIDDAVTPDEYELEADGGDEDEGDPPRNQNQNRREGNDEDEAIDGEDNIDGPPTAVVRDDAGVGGDEAPPPSGPVVVHPPPGAYFVRGPDHRDGDDEEVGTAARDDGAPLTAVVRARDDATPEARPVDDDEPSAVGIRMRSCEPGEGAAHRRGSFRDGFEAVVRDAAVVLDVPPDSTLLDCHPNRLREEMDDNIRAYYWSRLGFRISVVLCCLGLVGLVAGVLWKNREDSGEPSGGDGAAANNATPSFWQPAATLEGEIPGQLFGWAVALTARGESVLVGGTGEVDVSGTAQMFRIDGDETLPVFSTGDYDDLASGGTGSSVAATPHGDAIAISHGNRSGPGYIRVYVRDVSRGEFTPVGEPMYGSPRLGDQFATSIALAMFHFEDARGLLVLGGSRGGGYVCLWATALTDKGNYGPWIRLDERMYDEEGETAVALVGGNGPRFFVGSPDALGGRGIVRVFGIDNLQKDGDGNLTASIREIVADEGSGGELLTGTSEGDRFGNSISADRSGGFVVIGSERGGYARTLQNVWKDNAKGDSSVGQWQSVGNGAIEVNTCSSVSTGKIRVGSCGKCGNPLNGTRVVLASDGMAFVYRFDEGTGEWAPLGDGISAAGEPESVPCPSELVRVAMSPNSQEVAVACPSTDGMRGRVSVYKIS